MEGKRLRMKGRPSQPVDDRYSRFEDMSYPNFLREAERKTETAIVCVVMDQYLRVRENDDLHGLYLALRFFSLVRKQVTESGGIVVKSLGDDVIARFDGSDGSGRAVEAAKRIQVDCRHRNSRLTPDHRITSNIGIDCGDVLDLNGDPHGRPVDVAAYLARLAKGGQVLISSDVHDRAPIGDLCKPADSKSGVEPVARISGKPEERKFRGVKNRVRVFEIAVYAEFGPIGWPLESLVEWKYLHISLTNILQGKEDCLSKLQRYLMQWRGDGLLRAQEHWQSMRQSKRDVYNEFLQNVERWPFVTSDGKAREYLNQTKTLHERVSELLALPSLSAKEADMRESERNHVLGTAHQWYKAISEYQEYAEETIRTFLERSA